ncbi:MAG: hypothetical protein H0X33_11095 [Taibaiella sp.]|nr:hypothetical protein [Taibaiella sp.]
MKGKIFFALFVMGAITFTGNTIMAQQNAAKKSPPSLPRSGNVILKPGNGMPAKVTPPPAPVKHMTMPAPPVAPMQIKAH